MAEGILRGAQKVADSKGIDLDVGEFPTITLIDTEGDSLDPERPVRLVAHIIARGADRSKFLRKFSRHMEGREAKAGIVSDILAVGYELARRNSDELEKLGREYVESVIQKGKDRKAAERAAQTRQTGVTQ